MGDVERITTTERHAELREAVASVIATADGYNPNVIADPVMWVTIRDRYLVLADAAIERVVEGLVATIKALPRYNSVGEDWVDPDAVLAVVEAARKDTT